MNSVNNEMGDKKIIPPIFSPTTHFGFTLDSIMADWNSNWVDGYRQIPFVCKLYIYIYIYIYREREREHNSKEKLQV